jgi:hypothetical protein
VNPGRFKAPFLTSDEIERIAENIRGKYSTTQRIPVDVLGFAEFDLKLEFDFAPIQQLRQDAFLRPDLTGIWFDEQSFKSASSQQRLRFSAAHELGHFFLHKDIYGALNFTTVKQWISFIDAIPADQYYWIERHADEFADRFLMPTKELAKALGQTMQDVEREGLLSQGNEWVLEFCCRAMHSDFGVSCPAMQTRIRKSALWPPPQLAANPN